METTTATPLPEIDMLRVRRYALSLRLNDVQSQAIAASQSCNFKKGDFVFEVSLTRPYSPASVTCVIARRIQLTSLGKRQGTATRVEDGRNVLHQIYRNHSLLAATAAEVEAYAAEIGPLVTEEAMVGLAYCSLSCFHALRPQFRANTEREIRASLEAADRTDYRVEYR